MPDHVAAQGGVRLRTVLPVKIFRCQASYVKSVGGERMALNRTCRRCSRCEAQSRRPEHRQVVEYDVP